MGAGWSSPRVLGFGVYVPLGGRSATGRTRAKTREEMQSEARWGVVLGGYMALLVVATAIGALVGGEKTAVTVFVWGFVAGLAALAALTVFCVVGIVVMCVIVIPVYVIRLMLDAEERAALLNELADQWEEFTGWDWHRR